MSGLETWVCGNGKMGRCHWTGLRLNQSVEDGPDFTMKCWNQKYHCRPQNQWFSLIHSAAASQVHCATKLPNPGVLDSICWLSVAKIYKALSFVPCSLLGMIMVFFICYLISFQVKENKHFKWLASISLLIFRSCSASFKGKYRSI